MQNCAAARTACVDIPALPLQLLLQRRTDWAGRPAAVVDQDKPQGILLWVNAAARRHHIRPGMRYSAALSLASGLCAGEVDGAEIRARVEQLVAQLRGFSPEVEPWDAEPGVFWLGGVGLERLYGSSSAWARRILAFLKEHGWHGRVAVGFSRFGAFAAARAGRGPLTVFRDAAQERSAVGSVPLQRLAIAPALRDALEPLGVDTVAELLRLPAAGLRERFGAAAHDLQQLAAGTAWAPLTPVPEISPLVQRIDLDTAERDVHRLLFRVKQGLDPLLVRLRERHEALVELHLGLYLDGAPTVRTEALRPAAPTLDPRQLLNLAHLRLDALELAAGVQALEMTARGVGITPHQLSLFAAAAARDPAAGERALARIRAEFGAGAVVRARLQEAHLPEARFSWEPLDKLAPPQPREVRVRPLVRRLFDRPVPLPPRGRNEPDGWLLKGEEYGHVVDCQGPYRVEGGWWRRTVRRDYHFARMRDGEVLWIFYDRVRRCWFLQGEVE